MPHITLAYSCKFRLFFLFFQLFLLICYNFTSTHTLHLFFTSLTVCSFFLIWTKLLLHTHSLPYNCCIIFLLVPPKAAPHCINVCSTVYFPHSAVFHILFFYFLFYALPSHFNTHVTSPCSIILFFLVYSCAFLH